MATEEYRRGYASGAAEDRAAVLDRLQRVLDADAQAEQELGGDTRVSEAVEYSLEQVKQLPFTVRDPNNVRVDTVAVADRKLLEEALKHVEDCFEVATDYGSSSACFSCGVNSTYIRATRDWVWNHEPGCLHVHVRDGLRKLLGIAMLLALFASSACAYWPQYYYRQTPGGTAVVPANQQQGYYQQRPVQQTAPRGHR